MGLGEGTGLEGTRRQRERDHAVVTTPGNAGGRSVHGWISFAWRWILEEESMEKLIMGETRIETQVRAQKRWNSLNGEDARKGGGSCLIMLHRSVLALFLYTESGAATRRRAGAFRLNSPLLAAEDSILLNKAYPTPKKGGQPPSLQYLWGVDCKIAGAVPG